MTTTPPHSAPHTSQNILSAGQVLSAQFTAVQKIACVKEIRLFVIPIN